MANIWRYLEDCSRLRSLKAEINNHSRHKIQNLSTISQMLERNIKHDY